MNDTASPRRVWPFTWAVIAVALVGSLAVPLLFSSNAAASRVLVGIVTFLLAGLAASVLSAITYLVSGRSVLAFNVCLIVVFTALLVFLGWSIAGRI